MNHKIEQFHQGIKAKISEINAQIEKNHKENRANLIGYFTFSLHLTHKADEENLCLGSYHVRNLTGKTITNPYICIHIPKDAPFSFTGKYVYEAHLKKAKNPDGWLRMNATEHPEKFWLKPLQHQSIRPNETISFTDFQVKWTPKKAYAGSIMGFTYSEEHQEGIAAINAINLSGGGYS